MSRLSISLRSKFAIASTLVAIAIAANHLTAQENENDLGSYTIRLMGTPGSDALAAELRNAGYSVSISEDEKTPQDLKSDENYPVISVGKSIPPAVAAKVISIAHQKLKSVRYIFLQLDNDRQLFLNAHKDWIPYLSLKPLTEQDFALLTKGDQSLTDFHKLIGKYQR
jgi:hypothetical protein